MGDLMNDNPFSTPGGPATARAPLSKYRQMWVDRDVVFDGAAKAQSSALYASWVKFCADQGWNTPGSNKALAVELMAAGYKIMRFKDGRFVMGVRLR